MGVREKVLALKWNKWLERPFGAFTISFFNSISPRKFSEIGAKGVEWEAFVFQDGHWFESRDVYETASKGIEKWLENHSVSDLSKSLEKFKAKSRRRLEKLARVQGNPLKQLREAYDIFTTATTFIWITHGLEDVVGKRARELVPRFVKGDVERFIADVSFPSKRNTHVLFEEAIRSRKKPEWIVKKFGWLKIRDGFADPFTVEEVKKLARDLKRHKKPRRVKIPGPLEPLFRDLRELVWFRTARTDAFYELLFLARPVFERVAKYYGMPFQALRNYSVESLVAGKPKYYAPGFTYANYKGKAFYSTRPLVKEEKIYETDSVKGTTAQKGRVKGIAKIVRFVSELDKVKKGDVLVTQMTFPSFMTAMARASAFVTDEGGITCHAAIIAREMRKPCVIGTKNATRVFRDGDLIEVDADNGVVRLAR